MTLASERRQAKVTMAAVLSLEEVAKAHERFSGYGRTKITLEVTE
jgi:hypothetical protein